MSVLPHVTVTLLLLGVASATCPGGWESNGKYCYKLNNDPSATSFDEQLASCRNQGGSLASIHDQATQHFLFQLAQSSSGPVYIGLFDPYRNGSWAWADGTPVDYTNWSESRPDNATGAEYCGQLEPTLSGQWEDGKCCGGGAGICQILDPDTCPCPTGWTFLPSTDSCYKLIKAENATGFNISGAVNACKNEDSQLISIHSRQEQELAYTLAIDAAANTFIGYYRNTTASPWYWLDGTPNNFTYWHSQEPRADGGCACLYSNLPTYPGLWNDLDCNGAHGLMQALCKQKAVSNPGNGGAIALKVADSPSLKVEAPLNPRLLAGAKPNRGHIR